jgi:acyl carrier protein
MCTAPQDGTRLIDMLRQSPPTTRTEILREFLRERLSEPLGIDPSQIGVQDRLMDLGIDSLKAVELKILVESQLNVDLGSSLLFDYPTLEALTDFLLQEAGLSGQERLQASPNQLGIPDDCSSEQIAELLAEELEGLRLSAEDT